VSRRRGDRGSLSLAKSAYRSKLDELMGQHEITNRELMSSAHLCRQTLADLRAGRRPAGRTLGLLCRVSVALGLAVGDVFPVVLKAPRKEGLVQKSLKRRAKLRIPPKNLGATR